MVYGSGNLHIFWRLQQINKLDLCKASLWVHHKRYWRFVRILYVLCANYVLHKQYLVFNINSFISKTDSALCRIRVGLNVSLGSCSILIIITCFQRHSYWNCLSPSNFDMTLALCCTLVYNWGTPIPWEEELDSYMGRINMWIPNTRRKTCPFQSYDATC